MVTRVCTSNSCNWQETSQIFFSFLENTTVKAALHKKKKKTLYLNLCSTSFMMPENKSFSCSRLWGLQMGILLFR